MNRFPPPNQNTPNQSAYQAAIQRAQQVASKLQSPSGDKTGIQPGVKRPSHDSNLGPEVKRINMDGGTSSEQIPVPDKMVGMIIGKGGEQITRLQHDSGCKIQMAPDSGGQSVRMCTLSGSPQAIAEAKSMIESIIANSGNMGGGGGGGGMGGGPPGLFEIMVPGNKVGLIIGKGGETIKMLQEQTGAKITIIQENSEQADQKPLRISGPPDAVEDAKARVMELLSQIDQNGFGGGRGRGRGGGMRGSPRGGGFGGRGGGMGRGGRSGWPSVHDGSGEKVDFVTVSSDKVGLVIGKGGETIKSINQASGAHCEIDKKAPPEATEKNFIIRGPPDSVDRAKQMVLEKIGAAPGSGYGAFPGQTFVNNGSGGGYNPPSGGYNPPSQGYDSQPAQYQPAPATSGPGAVNPTTGQPDYSSQWIEYYRSLGMSKEAEMIEQQVVATNPPVNPAIPQGGPGAPGGQDYSAQWADYYRSIGKVKEAEAIEAQMRAKSGSQPGYPGGGAPYTAQPGYPGQGYYPPQQPGYQGYD